MNNFKTLYHEVRKNIGLAQNDLEISWVVEKLKKLKPEIIIEIGMAQGGTLKFWEYVLKNAKDPLLIGIDIKNKIRWKTEDSPVNIQLIISSSIDGNTVDKVKELLDDRKVDMLFIDGDHSYDVCKKDYELYSPFVRDGGMIVFHDIAIDKDSVGKVFNELKGTKDRMEFGQGTGIFFKE